MMHIAACLALVLATLGAPPARAETAPLRWQYECLKTPDAVCYDATPSGSDPLPPAQETKAPPDPLVAIAARLQARKPSAADIAALQARARAGNARALELLAWAELVGVGVARDPVQAYFLYGKAAGAGAPTGHRDQAAIYQGILTPEERQQILLIETGNLASRP
jgi:TPR repeat protein